MIFRDLCNTGSMKKFIIILLTTFYLGVSSGATVHFHYCMGELMNWSLTHDTASKCSNCGMEKGNSKNCCKDEHHKLELKESPKVPAIVYDFNLSALHLLPVPFMGPAELFTTSTARSIVLSESPPRAGATSAFIRNCNFRI